MKYYNELRRCRVKANLTQEEVADVLGITPQAYSNYERGSRDMGSGNLAKCASLFGCTVDEVLGHDLPSQEQLKVKQSDELLSYFDNLNDEGKDLVLALTRAMSENNKYRVK